MTFCPFISVFPLLRLLTLNLLSATFLMLRYVTCIPNLARALIMKGWWILSKAFSASNKMSLLSLSLFMWFIMLISFHTDQVRSVSQLGLKGRCED